MPNGTVFVIIALSGMLIIGAAKVGHGVKVGAKKTAHALKHVVVRVVHAPKG